MLNVKNKIKLFADYQELEGTHPLFTKPPPGHLIAVLRHLKTAKIIIP